MSGIRTSDLIRAAEAQNRWLEGELQRLAEARGRQREAMSELEAATEEAWRTLAATLVPDLDEGRLARTAQMLALPALTPAAVAQKRESLERFATEKLHAVHGDPLYAAREARLNAADIRLGTLQPHLDTLAEEARLLQAEPLFEEIIRSGYGGDGYSARWWTFSYYRLWKHADLVVERHGPRLGAEDFGKIRTRYLQEQEALRTFGEEAKALRGEQQQIARLVDAEKRWRDMLQNLDQHLMDQLRGAARAHLEALELMEVHRLLAADREAAVAAKRIDGVAAKKRYLEAIFEQWVAGLKDDAHRMMEKNKRHLVKWRRPKNQGRQWQRGDYDRRFKDRRESWDKRYRRWDETRSSILAYDDYDTWDYRSPWWDGMTRGRVRGDFIPEVHHWHMGRAHEHHSAASWTTTHDDHFDSDVS